MQSLRPGAAASGAARRLPTRSSLSSFFDRPIPFRCPNHIPVRHATHGVQGRANGPKNGPGKRLGAKRASNEYVVTGNIIFRQRGTKWHPGENAGMGRDHTIFAMQSGYVKYYRNPAVHPKRQYIGITFEKEHQLPHPANAPRRRRLGMLSIPRKDMEGVVVDVTSSGSVPGDVDPLDGRPKTKNARREERRKRQTGRIPVEELKMRHDYSFREANWEIGRAAERAGVTVRKFEPGDRFRAWRKRTARKARSARMKVSSKRSKKDNKPRKGPRGGPPGGARGGPSAGRRK